MESVEASEDSGGSQMSQGSSDLFHPDVLQTVLKEVKKSHQRSQKTRIKLLTQISLYLEKISVAVSKSPVSAQMMRSLDLVQQLIVDLTELVISLSTPEKLIPEVYDLVYNMGAYVEHVGIAIYTRCIKAGALFGNYVKECLARLLTIFASNKRTWLYSVFIAPLVIHMMNVFADEMHQDFVKDWSCEVGDTMLGIGKSVFECGDFACQHFLVTVIACWAKWITPEQAHPALKMMFRHVDVSTTKELLNTIDDPDQCVRRFLNSFNLSPVGPRSVISLRCMCMFVSKEQVPSPNLDNSTDLWVDFSAQSGRIHVFHSTEGEAPCLVSLNIRKDQIDSVCVNWARHDEERPCSQSQTQYSLGHNDRVVFLHLVLNVDFDKITTEIFVKKKNLRSVYFAFGNCDEKLFHQMLTQMDYTTHKCGTQKCERPKKLRTFLAEKQSLPNGDSWCPESQVIGLDNTLQSRDSERMPSGSPHHSREKRPLSSNPSSVNLIHASFISYSVSNSSPSKTFDADETGDGVDLDESNQEDPLPPAFREKYRHLAFHSPFVKRPKDIADGTQNSENEPMSISPVPNLNAHSTLLQTPVNVLPTPITGLPSPKHFSTPIGQRKRVNFKGKHKTSAGVTPFRKGKHHKNDADSSIISSIRDVQTPPKTTIHGHVKPYNKKIEGSVLRTPICHKRTPVITAPQGRKTPVRTPIQTSSTRLLTPAQRTRTPTQETRTPLQTSRTPLMTPDQRTRTPTQGTRTPLQTSRTPLLTPAQRTRTPTQGTRTPLRTAYHGTESPLSTSFQELWTPLASAKNARSIRKTPFPAKGRKNTTRPPKVADTQEDSPSQPSAGQKNSPNQSAVIPPVISNDGESESPSLLVYDEIPNKCLEHDSSSNIRTLSPEMFSVEPKENAIENPQCEDNPMDEMNDSNAASEDLFPTQSQQLASKPCDPPNPPDGQPNSRESIDQENQNIPSTPDRPEQSQNDEMNRSVSMSPVFGYSKALENRDETESMISSEDAPVIFSKKNRTSPRNPVTSTCYENAFAEWTQKEEEKKKTEGYDPYDLLSSSQMDSYKEKLFPKKKTYAGMRKNGISKPSKRKNLFTLKAKKRGKAKVHAVVDIDSQDLDVYPHPPKTRRINRR